MQDGKTVTSIGWGAFSTYWNSEGSPPLPWFMHGNNSYKGVENVRNGEIKPRVEGREIRDETEQ